MTSLVWPSEVLVPSAVQFMLSAQTTSGGQAPNGSEQIVGNSPGRVKVTLSNIRIKTPLQVKAWRWLEASLGGRSGTILVPVYDSARGPFPTEDGRRVYPCKAITFSDGALFSDDAGFGQPVVVAEAAASIAAGAVTGSIRVVYGAELEPGMIFGAGEFAYVITQIVSVDNSGASPVYSVKFRLPARAAITSGDTIEFDNPVVRCRLASDEEMALPLSMWRFGSPSVQFVEDV